MSTKSTPSPRQRPSNQVDDPQLPAGHCRYILLLPEVKGQRCGCAHFNLNRSTPDARCECGHLSCYHVNNGEPPSLVENQDLTYMKQRLEQLEREHVELHQLHREVMLLRQRIDYGQDRQQETIVRLSQLEDTVDRSQAETSQEVQDAYRNLGRAWDSITDLMHHKKEVDDHLQSVDEHLHSLDIDLSHLDDRHTELADAEISLEDRVDNHLELLEDRIEVLEGVEGREAPRSPVARDVVRDGAPRVHSRGNASTAGLPSSNRLTRSSVLSPVVDTRQLPRPGSQSPAFSLDPSTPKATGPPTFSPVHSAPAMTESTIMPPVLTTIGRARSPARHRNTPMLVSVPIPPSTMPVRPAAHFFRGGSGSSSSSSSSSAHGGGYSNELWTVHVSLLPTSTQPFPFERDTNAYKRCLSRGLHQMVAVSGASAEAFGEAITRSFGRILRSRKWVPLQALPCTAERLAGLPMLRPLDPSLLDERWGMEFLRNHCAVCDSNGKIDSLYIAMQDKTLSWHSIRRLPIFLQNLELCWNYDPLLDANDPFVDDDYDNGQSSGEDEVMGGMARPPAGDIVATLPSLKRAASEMSRSSSFGSATATTPTAALAPTSVATVAEGEGSRPKVPRIYPLPNIVEVRRSVKTS